MQSDPGTPLARLTGTWRGRGRTLRRQAAAKISSSEYFLSALPLPEFDVFTLVSRVYWEQRREMVVGLFRDLKLLAPTKLPRAFLVAHHQSDCEEASVAHGIRCVVSRNYLSDPTLSKEKQHIMWKASPWWCHSLLP